LRNQKQKHEGPLDKIECKKERRSQALMNHNFHLSIRHIVFLGLIPYI